jgi:hypothetical protein
MRRFVVVLGAAIVAAACGSHTATAPTPPLVVALTGPATVQGLDTTKSGQAFLYCDYQLTATASGGSAGEVATWGSATYTYVLASNGETYSNTDQASAYFDGDPVVPGGSDVSQGHVAGWVGPFKMYLVLYYSTPQSSTDSALYNFSCQ